jgi:hypothetical protein
MSAWSRTFTNLHLVSMPFAYLSFHTLKNEHLIIIKNCGSLDFITVIKFLSWNFRTALIIFYYLPTLCPCHTSKMWELLSTARNENKSRVYLDTDKQKQLRITSVRTANFILDPDIWQPNTKFWGRVQSCGYYNILYIDIKCISNVQNYPNWYIYTLSTAHQQMHWLYIIY